MKHSKFFISTLIAAAAMTANAYADTLTYSEYEANGLMDNLVAAWSFDSDNNAVYGSDMLSYEGVTYSNNFTVNSGIATGSSAGFKATGLTGFTGEFTISFDFLSFNGGTWCNALALYTNNGSNQNNVLQFQKNAQNQFCVYTSGFTGSNVVNDDSNILGVTNTDSLPVNITLTFADSALTAYVNGKAFEEKINFTYADGVTPGSLTGLVFGGLVDHTNRGATVSIDNVAIWNSALTADQIDVLQGPKPLTWDNANGSWTDENAWLVNDSAQATFKNGDSVILNSGSVSIDDGITVSSDKVMVSGTVEIANNGTLTTSRFDVDSGAITLSGTGTTNIETLQADSQITISGKVNVEKFSGVANVNIKNGGMLTITSSFAGRGYYNGTITIEEGGVVDISKEEAQLFSTNWCGGNVTIKGELKVANYNYGGSLGSLKSNKGTVSLDGGTLSFMSSFGSIDQVDGQSRSTVVTTNGGCVLVSENVSVVMTGFKAADNASFETGASGTLEFDVAKGGSLTLAGDYGIIRGGAGVSKTGVGDLILSGNNTFTGGISISKGIVETSNASALGSGDVSIATGAQLKLNANLEIKGDVKLVVSANDIVNVNSKSVGGLITTDSSAGVTLAPDKHLYVNLVAVKGYVEMTNEGIALQLAAGGALSNLTQEQIKIGSEYGAFMHWTDDTDWMIKGWNGETGVLTLGAIPEPSAFGLLAGLGALALAGTRRRRHR